VDHGLDSASGAHKSIKKLLTCPLTLRPATSGASREDGLAVRPRARTHPRACAVWLYDKGGFDMAGPLKAHLDAMGVTQRP
jgi:hypothetical protein